MDNVEHSDKENFTNTLEIGLTHGAKNLKRVWDNRYCVGESTALIIITTKPHKPLPSSGIPRSRAVTDGGECSTSQLGNNLTMLLDSCMKS